MNIETDMKTIDSELAVKLAEALLPCKHHEWDGIPEVDAVCKDCQMDEFMVAQEREHLYNRIVSIMIQHARTKAPSNPSPD